MRSCRWLHARLALTTILAAFVVGVARAHADSPPPLEGGVTCATSSRERYRVGAVTRQSLPVRVTSDGPAKFFANAQVRGDDAAGPRPDRGSPESIPNIARLEPTDIDGMSGTVTARVTKAALRIMRWYGNTKVISG